MDVSCSMSLGSFGYEWDWVLCCVAGVGAVRV